MVLPCLASVVIGVGVVAQPLSMDGDFADWGGVGDLATDVAGDGSGIFDVTWVKARSEGAILYVHFDIGAVVNLQSGPSGEGTQVVRLEAPDGSVIGFDFRSRAFTVNGAPAPWTTLNFVGAPTFASDRFEMRFDLSGFGGGPGAPVEISMSGSDDVDPVVFTMSGVGADAIERDPARGAGTSFRAANLNTLFTGLLDAQRGPQLRSLIDAVDADVYTFQEEWDSTVAQIATVLEATDPHEDGASWNVVSNNGTVVASRSPLLALPATNSRYMPAIVDLPTGAVLVIGVHLKCCGYTGSSEDNQRIAEVNAILGTIADLRDGSLGAAFDAYRDAPTVVVGDWNLVGSRTPLDVFEGAGLARAHLLHLAGRDIFTWRNPGSDFTPGYLDLFAYDAAAFTLRNRFVLDSAGLSPALLTALGLASNASNGSDHLMVVSDFTMGAWPVCPGDATGNGSADFEDLNEVLAHWGEVVIPGDSGDVDVNGTVDFGDLNQVLDAWAAPCP